MTLCSKFKHTHRFVFLVIKEFIVELSFTGLNIFHILYQQSRNTCLRYLFEMSVNNFKQFVDQRLTCIDRLPIIEILTRTVLNHTDISQKI